MLLILAAVVAVSVCLVIWPPNGEPRYGGKKLSEWLKASENRASEKEAAVAVRHMGTNALPYLIEWVRESEGKMRFRARVYFYLRSQRWLPQSLRYRFIGNQDDKRKLAFEALRILGSEAAPAIPGFVRMLNEA